MLIVLLSVSLSFKEGKHVWENGMNQGKLERRPVVIVTACMKARKYKTLLRKAWTMARQKEHPNPASYHITIRDWIQNRLRQSEIKKFARIKSVSIRLHIFRCVSWAWRYPTTESLDDLDASRTGIHHHVMYTTPSLPTMLSHMVWFPCNRFWDFTKSFFISRCIFLHDKSLGYIPPTSSYTESLASFSRATFRWDVRFACIFSWLCDDTLVQTGLLPLPCRSSSSCFQESSAKS